MQWTQVAKFVKAIVQLTGEKKYQKYTPLSIDASQPVSIQIKIKYQLLIHLSSILQYLYLVAENDIICSQIGETLLKKTVIINNNKITTKNPLIFIHLLDLLGHGEVANSKYSKLRSLNNSSKQRRGTHTNILKKVRMAISKDLTAVCFI